MSEIIAFPLPAGPNYTIPDVGELNWGQEVTNFLVALPLGVPPTAGTFALTGDLSFGASYGLVSKYLISQASNPASTGFLRLAKTDALSWRNNANSADLPLAIDGSDNLTFNGMVMQFNGTVNPGTQYQLGYYATSSDAISGLTLITPSKVLVSDANGLPTASGVTPTTLSYLDATSSIQTQINAVVATANAALPEAGGTMSGNIAMGSHSITGLANGINPQDAATVSQVSAVSGFQSGDLKAAAYSATPSGWLLCDGTSYSTGTYPALFAAIGYAYGGSSGNFNVPNMINYVPVGQGGSIAGSLGASSGDTTYTLAVSQLPSGIPVTITDPGHIHALNHTYANLAGGSSSGGVDIPAAVGGLALAATSSTTGITAVANGSGSPYTVVQPSLGVNWFIKI